MNTFHNNGIDDQLSGWPLHPTLQTTRTTDLLLRSGRRSVFGPNSSFTTVFEVVER